MIARIEFDSKGKVRYVAIMMEESGAEILITNEAEEFVIRSTDGLLLIKPSSANQIRLISSED